MGSFAFAADFRTFCRAFLSAYETRLDDNAADITKMMGKPLAQARGEFAGTLCERR